MKFFLKTAVSALIFLLPTTGLLYGQQTADVRTVRWGFSPKQVKEAEPTKPTSVKKEKLIYARTPINDRIMGLEYEFNGDSLLSASYYYYTTASVTKDDVLAASVEFEKQMTDKYGRGKTALLGDTRNIIWLTPRTQITLSVGNVDRGWSVELVYLCRVCSGQPVKDVKGKR
ncbi:hypothetical protein [Spirosoma radiotolerans]|uniref:hypothetical protein n=1 Tax=Spirosoma radiotolerans TaxID=1379870 RepID=UPI000697C4F8|nr:hypothetical protein [Spirosoma radiotolerans]